jgi:hypothetical protein
MTNEEAKRSEGRPRQTPQGGKTVALYLPLELIEQYKKLGASKWVQQKIKETMK